MSVKPLAGGVAAVGSLEVELQGLNDSACLIRDKFNGNLAGDTASCLTDGDRSKRPVGLTKGHDGRSTNERANRLRDHTLQGEVDNFSNETQEKIRRSRPYSITNVGRPEPRTTGSRSGRE